MINTSTIIDGIINVEIFIISWPNDKTLSRMQNPGFELVWPIRITNIEKEIAKILPIAKIIPVYVKLICFSLTIIGYKLCAIKNMMRV